MKAKRYHSVLKWCILLIIGGTTHSFGQLGIGTNSPHASSMLEVVSTTKGVLIPRMTNTQMGAINSPATGLLVYCTDCNPVNIYLYNGTSWVSVNTDAQDLSLSGNTLSLSGDATSIDLSAHIGGSDELGNHTATQNLNLETNKLVGNGGSNGISITSDGKVSLNTGVGVNEFSSDGTMAGNSDDAIPTEKAVRSYINSVVENGLVTVGDYNYYGGEGNLTAITTGQHNIAIGSDVLNSIQSADENVAIGSDALKSNVSGQRNIAIGRFTMEQGNPGDDNAAVGLAALRLGAGKWNVAFGAGALHNGPDIGNTAVGFRAGHDAQGNWNIFLGHNAGRYETGSDKLYIQNSYVSNPLIGADFFHRRAGINKDITSYASGATFQVGGDIFLQNGVAVDEFSTDGTLAGNSNTAVPTEAAVKTYIDNNVGGLTAIGTNNSVGHSSNIAGIGTGSINTTAIGIDAMKNTSGDLADNNVALGWEAGYNVTGANNTLIGAQAGKSVTSGEGNVTLGYGAGGFGSMGSYNVIMGNQAAGNTVGNRNVFIGIGAGYFETGSNKLYIETGVNALNPPLIGGDFAADRVGINRPVSNLSSGATFQVGGDASMSTAGSWSANSDRRLKTNIQYMDSEEILTQMLRMKGAMYEWNDTVTSTPRPSAIQYGFIAQDIEKVWPSKITKDGQGYLMTAYGDYDPMFVESIRAMHHRIAELEKENAELEDKAGKVKILKEEVAAIKEMLAVDEVVRK